jgi:hypothetical protein
VIYDYRIYEAPDTSKMPVLTQVIGDFMSTFAKFEMRVVGVWTPLISDNNTALHYMLEFRDYAHMEAAWAGYLADADAQAAFYESFGGDFTWLKRVRNYLMEPTPFSPPIGPPIDSSDAS